MEENRDAALQLALTAVTYWMMPDEVICSQQLESDKFQFCNKASLSLLQVLLVQNKISKMPEHGQLINCRIPSYIICPRIPLAPACCRSPLRPDLWLKFH